MAATDVVVGQGEVAVGQASDREGLVAQLDPLTRREDERAERCATRRLTELRRDAEAARFEGVLDPERDADRAHEVVALLAGVLAGGLDELGAERVLDVGEPGVVLGREVDREFVGHHPPALDVDGPLVVHLADQSAAELDRPDGVAGTAREHTIDHTL